MTSYDSEILMNLHKLSAPQTGALMNLGGFPTNAYNPSPVFDFQASPPTLEPLQILAVSPIQTTPVLQAPSKEKARRAKETRVNVKKTKIKNLAQLKETFESGQLGLPPGSSEIAKLKRKSELNVQRQKTESGESALEKLQSYRLGVGAGTEKGFADRTPKSLGPNWISILTMPIEVKTAFQSQGSVSSKEGQTIPVGWRISDLTPQEVDFLKQLQQIELQRSSGEQK